jgi:glycosyltransferase involved in cell wall biosynthesis
MIKLAINARYKNRPLTGVERFAWEVEKELCNRRGLQIREINPGRELSGLKGHAWEQLILPGKVAASEILFSPCNTGPVLVKNQIVVIHDAAVWDYPEGFSRSFGTLYRTLLPRLAKNCRQVATVSEFSRTRLAEHLRLPQEKILVLGNATSPGFRPALNREKSAPPRFFCVSSLDPRKNFQQLIQAWELLQARHELPAGTTLRIAGGANPRNFSAVEVAASPTVQWLGRISDAELIQEYQAATAFIFPSLYEGFGLPPLEAMACGTPVLLSDRASLPEVGGPAFDPSEPNSHGAVLYFDPSDVDSISTTIRQILALKPDQMAQISQNAVKRSQRFSWARVTDKLIDAL